MIDKALLSGLAMLLTLVAFLPYIRGIARGSVRPHVLSWVIWSVTTLGVALAQLQDGAGAGGWAIAVSGAISLAIALLAYARRGDLAVTRGDRAFFVAAVSALPVWYLTAEPVWSVVILTAIDLMGFGPTLRKAYAFPRSESAVFFGLFLLRNALVLAALERYSAATVLFPLAIGLACGVVVGVLLWRRAVEARAPASPPGPLSP